MKKFFITVLMLNVIVVFGQQKFFTLQQCIDTALKNNLLINQGIYRVEYSELDWKQSKLNKLPNINAHNQHSNNQGRSIDPSTNAYVAQRFSSANYSLNGEVILFQGLTLSNLVRQRSMDYEAAKMDLQQQKDNITIHVILAYLQMMNTEDMLIQLQSQSDLSQKQVERLNILNDKGAIAPAVLYDVQGQLANDQVAIINTKNALGNLRIALCRLMGIPYEKDMEFKREISGAILNEYNGNTQAAYETALNNFAKVKAAEYRRRSAEEAIKVAKGSLFPTLKFGTGFYSNYSTASQGKYFNQLNNNISSAFALTLHVPVFNSFRVRKDIKKAKINLKDYTLQKTAVKTELQQDIEEAYNNVTGAFERYEALLQQFNYLSLSFKAAEAKFNVGQGTSIDYLIVKNNLDKAAINLISAKYDYLLRVKIYEYYQGITYQ